MRMRLLYACLCFTFNSDFQLSVGNAQEANLRSTFGSRQNNLMPLVRDSPLPSLRDNPMPPVRDSPLPSLHDNPIPSVFSNKIFHSPLQAALEQVSSRHAIFVTSQQEQGKESKFHNFPTVIQQWRWRLYSQSFCDPDTVEALIPVAVNRGMDVRTVSFPLQGNISNSVLTSAVPHWESILVVLLCSSDDVISYFTQVSSENLENPWVAYIVLYRSGNQLREVQSVLREGSQVLAIVELSSSKSDIFKSVVIDNDHISFSKIGRWRHLPSVDESQRKLKVPWISSSSLKQNTGNEEVTFSMWDTWFPTRKILSKMNLNGRHLLTSVVDDWPFFGLKEENGAVVADSGIDVSVLTTLSKAMNFTFGVVSPADGQWGGPSEDGNITGMIGMVARHDAHLAIDEITITGAREVVVDFSRPYYMESSTVLARAPAQASKAFAVFSPYTPTVWGIIVAAVIGVGLLVGGMSHLRGRFLLTPDDLRLKKYTTFDYCYNILKGILVQDNRTEPTTHSLRVLLAFWYLFCYVIYALYAGTLTAMLTLPTYEKAIDSLEDLLNVAKKDLIVPAVVAGSSIQELFESEKQGIYYELAKKFRSDSFKPTVDDGVKSVLTSEIGLVEATLACEIRATVLGRDRFYLARQSFYPQSYGIACRVGAPYLITINALLSRIVEGGFISKWKSDELQKVSSKQKKDELQNGSQTSVQGLEAFKIIHLQGAFFLYLLGMMLSAAVFMLETVRAACNRQSVPKNR